MLYKIIKADGSVAIMQIIDDKSDISAEIAKWPLSVRSQVVSAAPVDLADLPQDRTFRAAWRDVAGRVEVDLEAAKQIKMAELRKQRNEKLAALDLAYIKADEANSRQQKDQVAAQKQALRDLPTTETFASVKTAAELKDYIPTILR